MEKIYRKSYRILTYDVDVEGKAHLPALLDFLQDAARDQSGLLGFSVSDLQKKNLTWVMSRYHIRVPRYPRLGDTVEVSTWTSGKKGPFALREFELRTPDGGMLLEATSSWMIISMDARQPVRLDGLLPDDISVDRRAIPDAFERLPEMEGPGRETIFRAGFRDLDFNRHVNNVVYVHWAIEGMPENVLRSRRASEIEVVYKAEAFYGDEIGSLAAPGGPSEPGVYLHRIVNRRTGAELARLRTVWP